MRLKSEKSSPCSNRSFINYNQDKPEIRIPVGTGGGHWPGHRCMAKDASLEENTKTKR